MQQYRKNLGKVSLTAEGAWNLNNSYDILSIVYDEHTQHGFISRKAVPQGVDLYNKEYWMPLNVSGYADNNVIILSKKTSEASIQSYTLEEAIASIKFVGRRPGAILGFYNENNDRLDIGGRWELWQFNDTNIYNWDNVDSWQNLYYNYNKFMGWFKDENLLSKYAPFPEIGCYAFVGSEFNEATVYRCDNKYVWSNTTQHAWDYVKVIVDGNVTVGENGNWFNNGEDTGIPASVKGENGKTPVFREKDNTIQYSFDNVNWITISNKVAAWFRWNATTGDTQSNNVGRIQITRDNVTWTNLSEDIINNLHISRYIGADESLPTSDIAEGTIYAKGPYYAEDDTLNDNPIYRLWVYAWKGNTLAWQDNGEFTSIAAGVVQETGDSETAVMSQKAVSRELKNLFTYKPENFPFQGKYYNTSNVTTNDLVELEPTDTFDNTRSIILKVNAGDVLEFRNWLVLSAFSNILICDLNGYVKKVIPTGAVGATPKDISIESTYNGYIVASIIGDEGYILYKGTNLYSFDAIIHNTKKLDAKINEIKRLIPNNLNLSIDNFKYKNLYFNTNKSIGDIIDFVPVDNFNDVYSDVIFFKSGTILNFSSWSVLSSFKNILQCNEIGEILYVHQVSYSSFTINIEEDSYIVFSVKYNNDNNIPTINNLNVASLYDIVSKLSENVVGKFGFGYLDYKSAMKMPKPQLRNMVELASNGSCTVIWDDYGYPSMMYRIPVNSITALDNTLGDWTETHPAFIVDGEQKKNIYMACYQTSFVDGHPVSWIGLTPSINGNNLMQLKTVIKNKGAGWHLETIFERSLIIMLSNKYRGTKPRGNTFYGTTHLHNYRHEVVERVDGKTPGEVNRDYGARWINGTQPTAWSHNNERWGVQDLIGGDWEWIDLIKFVNGQIYLCPDNNYNSNESEWVPTGVFINVVNGKIVLDTKNTNNDSELHTCNWVDTSVSQTYDLLDESLREKLVSLMISPKINSTNSVKYDYDGKIWIKTQGEYYLIHGGAQEYASECGFGEFVAAYPNNETHLNMGSRLCYIE